MAATLPTKKFGFPGTSWSWSFNPGPFNMKEHVLISIFANTGAGGAYATGIITIVKAFYHRQLNVAAAMLLTQTTQVLNHHNCVFFSMIFYYFSCSCKLISLLKIKLKIK